MKRISTAVAHGDTHLTAIDIRNNANGTVGCDACGGLFVFIAGERDEVITSVIGARSVPMLGKSVPKLRETLLIPGAGHWIQQERPLEVNAALLRFLAADYPACCSCQEVRR